MSISDKDIDTGLQRLAQLAPDESAWAEIEKQLPAQEAHMSRLGFRPGLMFGSGIAATLVLGAVLMFYMPGLENKGASQRLGGPDSFVQAFTEAKRPKEFTPISDVELADVELAKKTGDSDAHQQSSGKQAFDKPPGGKYVRHLYGGDEALWDAMLAEEIYWVDEAILHSSPERQRKLWLYRKSLLKELTALRYQPVPEKYLF